MQCNWLSHTFILNYPQHLGIQLMAALRTIHGATRTVCNCHSQSRNSLFSIYSSLMKCLGINEMGVEMNIVYSGTQSWRVLACIDVSWRVLICLGVSWRVLTCHDVSWRVLMCIDVSWRVMMYLGVYWRLLTCPSYLHCKENLHSLTPFDSLLAVTLLSTSSCHSNLKQLC